MFMLGALSGLPEVLYLIRINTGFITEKLMRKLFQKLSVRKIAAHKISKQKLFSALTFQVLRHTCDILDFNY